MSTAASLLEQEDKQERAALHAHSDDAGVVVQQQQQPNDAAPSIRSNDTAESHTSSILSVTAAKAGKLKSKLKSKLHHSHHSHHDQEHDDDDGEEEEEDDDDEAHGGHRGRHQTSAGEMTPAQSYASSVTHPNATFNASTTTQDNTSAVAHAHRRASSAAASGTPLAKVNSRDFGGGRASLDGATRSASPSVSAGANAAAAERNNTKSPGGASDAASIRSNLPPVESDWRRSAEFHNLFQEVDADEQLVSDYTSAWSKDILRHGRLYVGERNLAFICTIIGLKTHCVIPYEDIESIEKANTARVIPNAINITTVRGDSHLFASFVYRDHSYDVIVNCWKAVNPSAYEKMVSSEVANVETVIEQGTEESPFPTETAAPVTERTAHEATQCSGNHLKETVLDVRFPSEPEKIYKLVFEDDEFMRKICEAQKLKDLKVQPWSNKKRSYTYVKPLSGSVGPSQTTCHIADEILAKDPEKAFEVVTVTKTPDVPSGGSFEVQTKTCLTWAGGAKGGCRMVATTDVVWSGRSMIKGIITSASIAGQRDYNKELAKTIRAHIKAHPDEFASGDVNAPEADDEIHANDDEKAENEGVAPPPSPNEAGVLAGEDSGSSFLSRLFTFGSTSRGKVQTGNYAVEVLALSNLVLLVILFTMWITGNGGVATRRVKVNKIVMSASAEVDALQRLQEMEERWKAFSTCIELLGRSSSSNSNSKS